MEAGPGLANDHPLRRALANEVHARPFEVLAGPVRASHLAVLVHPGADERAGLLGLCRAFGALPPGWDGDSGFLSVDLGPVRLRWERHAEFSTYTFFRFGPFADPFAATALEPVPAAWLRDLPADILVAAHVAVGRDEPAPADLARLFAVDSLAGSLVNGGAGAAWTDFRIHGDGFGRFLVRDIALTQGQTGRLVQRLVDIETYRMMALLALPVAKTAMPEIGRIEAEVAEIVTALAREERDDHARALLGRLTAIAAEAERLSARTSYRFGAGRAYHDLVLRRIATLRESRIAGLQTVAEFMERRLAPAMNTCTAAAARLEEVSRHLARANDLLRTRVDIALEENNRDLLRSVDRRAKLQLHLQQTVEGLSVAAISYYLMGLIGYAAKGAKAAGLPVDTDVAALAGLPLVLGLVWLGVRRLRRAVGRE